MKQNVFFAKQNSGQTLVEAVVVIGMVLLMVTGLIVGTITSLKTARSGRSRSQATKLAQDAIENIRSIRDTKWSTFALYDGHTYCLGVDNIFVETDVYTPCQSNIVISGESYTRTVSFTWDPIGEKMDVKVSVAFLDGTDIRTVELQTYFTDWK